MPLDRKLNNKLVSGNNLWLPLRFHIWISESKVSSKDKICFELSPVFFVVSLLPRSCMQWILFTKQNRDPIMSKYRHTYTHTCGCYGETYTKGMKEWNPFAFNGQFQPNKCICFNFIVSDTNKSIVHRFI